MIIFRLVCTSHVFACSDIHVHVYTVFAMLCILIDAPSMVLFLPQCYATGIDCMIEGYYILSQSNYLNALTIHFKSTETHLNHTLRKLY